MNDLIESASALFHIPARELCGPLRLREVVAARQAVMWAAQRQNWTLKAIGAHLGGRDHTTIIHGVKAAESRAADDKDYALQLAALL